MRELSGRAKFDGSFRLLGQAAWAPAAVVLAHAAASRLWGHGPYVDPVMHFLGGMAVAYFFRCAASLPLLGISNPLSRDLLALGWACIAALLWECGEFASDQLFGTSIQVSVADTMWDLILGMCGAILVLCLRRLGSQSTTPKGAS